MKEDSTLPIHSLSLNSKTTYPPTMSTSSTPRKARGIARLTVQISSAFRKDAGKMSSDERQSSPPRWGTLEFRIYYLCAVVALSLMVWIPVSLSQCEHYFYSRSYVFSEDLSFAHEFPFIFFSTQGRLAAWPLCCTWGSNERSFKT